MDNNAILEALKGFEEKLDKLSQPPTTSQTPVTKDGDEGTEGDGLPAIIDYDTQLELRAAMSKWSMSDLQRAFAIQAVKGSREGAGVPLALHNDPRVLDKATSDPELRKLLDTAGAGALIRQDLAPMLYAMFVKRFPLFDRLTKTPSNGLVHAYNRIISFGDAQFITDVGAVTDDATVYQRATSNVAVLATRRGISLKAQFAVNQGGAGYQPETEEVNNGVLAITRRLQRTILQGNATEAAGAGAATELGAFDANAFDGLRMVQRATNAFDLGTDTVIKAVDRAVAPVMDGGGFPTLIVMSTDAKRQLDNELNANLRYQPQTTEIAAGIVVNTINTVAGPLPILVVPGDTLGTYSSGGDTVSDIYVLDESRLVMPWLGSDGPTVLEIPVGVSGQLTRLYIIFCMYGLAHISPSFQAKLRVPTGA